MHNIRCILLQVIKIPIQNYINNKEIYYISLTGSLKVGQAIIWVWFFYDFPDFFFLFSQDVFVQELFPFKITGWLPEPMGKHALLSCLI